MLNVQLPIFMLATSKHKFTLMPVDALQRHFIAQCLLAACLLTTACCDTVEVLLEYRLGVTFSKLAQTVFTPKCVIVSKYHPVLCLLVSETHLVHALQKSGVYHSAGCLEVTLRWLKWRRSLAQLSVHTYETLSFSRLTP